MQAHPAGFCFKGPLAYIQACCSESPLSSECGPVQLRCPHRTECFLLLNTHAALIDNCEAHGPLPSPEGSAASCLPSRTPLRPASGPAAPVFQHPRSIPSPPRHLGGGISKLPMSPFVSSVLQSCRPSLPMGEGARERPAGLGLCCHQAWRLQRGTRHSNTPFPVPLPCPTPSGARLSTQTMSRPST